MSIVQFEGRGGEIMETESAFEVQTPNASYAVIKATIDSQIATARAFPRSIDRAISEVKTYASKSQSIAKSCIYALPRDGKTIQGPSARFAEILASCWGNLSVQGRVIEETEQFVVVVGECIDLQRNNRCSVEVRRGITYRGGKKYSADMIATTANAAISIAIRNATFKVIPRAFWESSYEEVLSVYKGQLKSVDDERNERLAYWYDAGVDQNAVFASLGVKGKEEITVDHIILMDGWKNSFESHESRLDDIFPTSAAPASPKVEKLTAKIIETKSAAKPKADAKPQDLPWEPGSNG